MKASCLGLKPSRKPGHFCHIVVPAGVLFQHANPSNVVGQYKVWLWWGSGVDPVLHEIKKKGN